MSNVLSIETKVSGCSTCEESRSQRLRYPYMSATCIQCFVFLFLFAMSVNCDSIQCGLYRVQNCGSVSKETCLSSYTYHANLPVPCQFGDHDDCVTGNTQCSNICTCNQYVRDCRFLIPGNNRFIM
jgi:hypothetical protein